MSRQDEAEKLLPAEALKLVLDHIDYTKKACGPTEAVGAVLPDDIIKKAHFALKPPPVPRDGIDRQNREFDALTRLAKKWTTLQRVAVVDDDYPEYRHYYEGALKDFIEAIRVNGRLPVKKADISKVLSQLRDVEPSVDAVIHAIQELESIEGRL